ncbi:MAG TPA: DUF892 family protein [Flavobacteriales bacterium]|nr:DUF892 family protein [Flavobacteriales bacterium]
MFMLIRFASVIGVFALIASNWSEKPQPVSNPESRKLFETELKDMYYVENRLVIKISELEELAMGEELKKGLQEHRQETLGHAKRLEDVFAVLGLKPEEHTCKGINGILDDGDEVVKEFTGTAGLDQAIITGARKAEHYEISSYMTLVALARQMDLDPKLEILLRENLQEERISDEKLAQLFDDTSAMR